MPKTFKILFFCMIFVSGPAIAQSDTVIHSVAKPSLAGNSLMGAVFSPVYFLNAVVPPDFYVNNLGFFCKKEIKFEAVTGIPFRFRLGSVEDCDRLEGKKNAGILPAY
jgi:hypothetical protein